MNDDMNVDQMHPVEKRFDRKSLFAIVSFRLTRIGLSTGSETLCQRGRVYSICALCGGGDDMK